MKKKQQVLIAGLAALGLLAGACSSDSESSVTEAPVVTDAPTVTDAPVVTEPSADDDGDIGDYHNCRHPRKKRGAIAQQATWIFAPVHRTPETILTPANHNPGQTPYLPGAGDQIEI